MAPLPYCAGRRMSAALSTWASKAQPQDARGRPKPPMSRDSSNGLMPRVSYAQLPPPPPSRLKPPTSCDSSNGLMLVHGLTRRPGPSGQRAPKHAPGSFSDVGEHMRDPRTLLFAQKSRLCPAAGHAGRQRAVVGAQEPATEDRGGAYGLALRRGASNARRVLCVGQKLPSDL